MYNYSKYTYCNSWPESSTGEALGAEVGVQIPPRFFRREF